MLSSFKVKEDCILARKANLLRKLDRQGQQVTDTCVCSEIYLLFVCQKRIKQRLEFMGSLTFCTFWSGKSV